jgi:beta-phosphoglucomutase-like phosphatase (HAD superfamily)
MSISSVRRGRVPTPEAAWMVAEELGFEGDLRQCVVWLEDLQRGAERAKAVNVVQFINTMAQGRA